MFSRLPLPIVLPVVAAAAVAAIGISFGLIFLAFDDAFGHTVPLFVATGITALIMLGASLLHVRVARSESAQHSGSTGETRQDH